MEKGNENNKYLIFGAGKNGREALKKYKPNVLYFIDNDTGKDGKVIEGVTVKSFSKALEDSQLYSSHIIVASIYSNSIVEQLEKAGIKDFSVYSDKRIIGYYDLDEVVYNPYLINDRVSSEDEWNSNTRIGVLTKEVNRETDRLYGKNCLFNHVEIETINRCNGSCSFCPVSKNKDTRIFAEMTDDLFLKIITELKDIHYEGKIALFSNNEPLLDKKIVDRHRIAREMLPDARFHLFSNGTLWNIDIFKEMMKYLDELIIDNYHPELKLIKPCREIAEYCEVHTKYKKKVTIVLRDPNEILTTRGGDAPNRNVKITHEGTKCPLPFKQIIIRPDGKVSLCCNDPLGRDTMGDVSSESLLEIWRGKEFSKVREALSNGRGNWKHCKYCDVLSNG